jgi:hypothetical protein
MRGMMVLIAGVLVMACAPPAEPAPDGGGWDYWADASSGAAGAECSSPGNVCGAGVDCPEGETCVCGQSFRCVVRCWETGPCPDGMACRPYPWETYPRPGECRP